jgi:hypothetical protein
MPNRILSCIGANLFEGTPGEQQDPLCSSTHRNAESDRRVFSLSDPKSVMLYFYAYPTKINEILYSYNKYQSISLSKLFWARSAIIAS